ncbi:TolC family outer membrane protein [Litoreibacter arenae]|uniref:Type I secretion outer membrane protein, TolC n=1 Tax=Litoreibacter arenae DSM 19593 TaxID=1123360 RepID=S9RRY2_9RHOB|nr:TolC family outer membrane protein [Litoreibacter arenae]EPX80815.1 Type I secretion outer membrane protein, TolC precursor [Litoreibacter arenae DSM 19593]
MKRRYLGIVFIVAGLSLVPLKTTAETLASALTAAYNNSNLLEQNRALLRAEDEDVAIALSSLLPNINAGSSINYTDPAQARDNLTATVSLTLELLLWDFGRSALAVESAKETVLAARADLTQQEQNVLLDAVTAYVQVLRDQRVVQLRESNLRLITQELRAARDRFEVGEVTRTDVAQAEARLAQARGALVEAQGNLQISRELYKVAVGRAPSNLQAISQLPSLPKSLNAAQATAKRISPLINQVQHQIKANELNYAAAKAATRPRISLSGSLSHSSVTDNNSSVGLQMNVPIYQGGQLSALVRKSLAGVHASKAVLNQTALVVDQNVANAWSRLAVANAQVTSSDRQIRAAQIAFDGVREEAKLGARTTLDVLDAEQVLFDARTTRVVSETQVYSAAYGLLAAMGLLTTDALKLNVERYDPSEYYNAVKNAPVPISKSGKKLDRILERYQKN